MYELDASESLWRSKIERYRRAEIRHDRAVSPMARKGNAALLAELYVDLSNTAREIVYRAGREVGATFVDVPDFARDETITSVKSRVARYRLKWDNRDTGRRWFQRFPNEPWFDLGYWDEVTQKFNDVPAPNHPTPKRIDAPMVPNELKLNTERSNDMIGETPEALEAAATRALSRAAELRAVDAMEPTGDEATISWTWTPEYPDAKTYTFVGFRGDNAKWYVTGQNICRDGVTWRELTYGKFGKSLREGRFDLVTEWTWQGPTDDDE